MPWKKKGAFRRLARDCEQGVVFGLVFQLLWGADCLDGGKAYDEVDGDDLYWKRVAGMYWLVVSDRWLTICCVELIYRAMLDVRLDYMGLVADGKTL